MSTHDDILPLGVMTGLNDDPFEDFGKVRDMGFPTCQLGGVPDHFVYGPQAEEKKEQVRQALQETGVKVTSVFIMFTGHIWDLIDGPRTIGLVPPDTRGERAVHACAISNWARDVGITAVFSHVGFIPESPDYFEYQPFIRTMRALCKYVKENGQTFAFETGQETPATLRRVIEDIGLDNVGVNLDPANLILYGKAVPLDAVDVIGEFVLNTHCKDGDWPAPGGGLGHEMPLGEGKVNIREVIKKLYHKGFRGPLTIEREISGPQQIADIQKAKALLEEVKAELLGS